MTCMRCQKAIRPNEAYEKYDKFSASGPGATIHVHVVCPKEPEE